MTNAVAVMNETTTRHRAAGASADSIAAKMHNAAGAAEMRTKDKTKLSNASPDSKNDSDISVKKIVIHFETDVPTALENPASNIATTTIRKHYKRDIKITTLPLQLLQLQATLCAQKPVHHYEDGST